MTVFFSGCLHHCEGCHNPLAHNFENGRPFSQELQDEIIEYIKNTPYIAGITLSGGDPMFSAAAITPFVERVRAECPRINIWAYSGFTYEAILSDPIKLRLLRLCDVLVDGKFVSALKNPNLRYKGSSNQRTIDVQLSLRCGQMCVLEGHE